MPVYKDETRGTWYVKMSSVDPVTKKRKQTLKRGFKKKADAQKWEAENRVSKDSTAAPFSQMFEESVRFHGTTEETALKKRLWLQKYFPMYDTPVNRITKPLLINWRNSLEDYGFTTTYINEGIRFVKGVLRYTYDIYDIPPVHNVLRTYRAEKPDDAKIIWDVDEFQQFIDAVPEGYYRAWFTFVYWTGCRRGEALAVCKDDFDLENKTVHICKQKRDQSDGFRKVKTGRSDRVIAVDDATMEYLLPYIRDANPYVFGGTTSLSMSAVRENMIKGIKASGVKPLTPHGLRHSHASMLINNNVNVLAVSKRLGHASPSITLQVYAHLLQKTESEMRFIINDLRKTVS